MLKNFCEQLLQQLVFVSDADWGLGADLDSDCRAFRFDICVGDRIHTPVHVLSAPEG